MPLGGRQRHLRSDGRRGIFPAGAELNRRLLEIHPELMLSGAYEADADRRARPRWDRRSATPRTAMIDARRSRRSPGARPRSRREIVVWSTRQRRSSCRCDNPCPLRAKYTRRPTAFRTAAVLGSIDRTVYAMVEVEHPSLHRPCTGPYGTFGRAESHRPGAKPWYAPWGIDLGHCGASPTLDLAICPDAHRGGNPLRRDRAGREHTRPPRADEPPANERPLQSHCP
jgi:hypothetical protein